MKIEQYSVETIRNEYVTAITKQLQGKVAPEEFGKMLTLLDDFCSALNTNNIMLIKIAEEQPNSVPQPQYTPEQLDNIPEADEQYISEEETPQEGQSETEYDEFEEPITQEENNLKVVYLQKMAELEAREKALYELEHAKPKKFTDKIRQFETDNKDKKKKEENEDD